MVTEHQTRCRVGDADMLSCIHPLSFEAPPKPLPLIHRHPTFPTSDEPFPMYPCQLRFWLTILRARARLLYSLDLLWMSHTHHNPCRPPTRPAASRAHIARSLLGRRGLHLLSWDSRQQERWISHPKPCSRNDFPNPIFLCFISSCTV